MQWYKTKPLIRASEHIKAHMVCGAMKYIESHYEIDVLTDKLPVFSGGSRCIKLEYFDHICFLHGGFGRPQAADVIETLCVLGVITIIAVDMCGSFSP